VVVIIKAERDNGIQSSGCGGIIGMDNWGRDVGGV